MGNFQEQNLLLSSLWSLLSCSIWLGSFPTVAPSWNCVIAGDAAVINSKTSFKLLWLYLKPQKREPSKARNTESKTRNYSEFIFSTRVFETHFKIQGTLCLTFETKVGNAKSKWAIFTSHWFLWMKGWRQGGGGDMTPFGKSQCRENKLNKQSRNRVLSKKNQTAWTINVLRDRSCMWANHPQDIYSLPLK